MILNKQVLLREFAQGTWYEHLSSCSNIWQLQLIPRFTGVSLAILTAKTFKILQINYLACPLQSSFRF